MNYPVSHVNQNQYRYPAQPDTENRAFPVLPFLTGLAFGPFLYGALHPGGYYYPYPYPPPYQPYPYGYGYNPYLYKGYY
ncbi:hypothetical protein ACW2QC_05415 [Virgibacillus sp. FSP13]